MACASVPCSVKDVKDLPATLYEQWAALPQRPPIMFEHHTHNNDNFDHAVLWMDGGGNLGWFYYIINYDYYEANLVFRIEIEPDTKTLYVRGLLFECTNHFWGLEEDYVRNGRLAEFQTWTYEDRARDYMTVFFPVGWTVSFDMDGDNPVTHQDMEYCAGRYDRTCGTYAWEKVTAHYDPVE